MTHFSLDDLNDAQTLARNIHRLNCSKERCLERYLAPYEITAAQFKVLLLMYRDGLTTSAELCRDLYLDSGAMSRMLDRLQNKEMLVRVRSTNDRRQCRLELTEKGLSICRQFISIAISTVNDLMAPLTPEEVKEFDRLLKKLVVPAGL